MDITRGEATEKELDSLIRRRHERREVEEGERPAHELWHESEARYFEEQRRLRGAERYEYHCDQADRLRRTLEDLIARHEAAAERYLQDEPKGETA